MNINPQEFLNNVLKSLPPNIGKVDYSKMLDEAAKNGSIFNTNGNYGDLSNTRIFNFGTQSAFSSSASQQAKPQSYEQYSQRAAQLLEKADKALQDWRNSPFEEKAKMAEVNASIDLGNFAIEIQNAVSQASGEEKNKLESLLNQITAKCNARDTEVVAFNSKGDYMDHSTAVPNADSLIEETQNVNTTDEISQALEKLNSAKDQYQTQLGKYTHPEYNRHLYESIEKVERRIEELSQNKDGVSKNEQ